MRKKCCFIILHYQAKQETLSCIQSIKQMDNQAEIGIVVVDNASPNGSGIELEKLFYCDDQVIVKCNGENVGFSRGNNLGCSIAKTEWDPSFYVVTNNDTVFLQKQFLTLIDMEYQRSGFSVLGPDIVRVHDSVHQSPLGNNPPTIMRINYTIFANALIQLFAPLSYNLLNLYFHNTNKMSKSDNYNEYQRDVCLMGACMIFSKDFVERKRIIFAPETQFYYEEYILALYCKKKGEVSIYNPEIVVLHNEGVATEKLSTKQNSKLAFRIENILESAKVYRRFLKECRRECMDDITYN